MARSYVEVTLHPDSESALNAEAEDIAEQREIEAELLKRKAEAEERKKKKIREVQSCSGISLLISMWLMWSMDKYSPFSIGSKLFK